MHNSLKWAKQNSATNRAKEIINEYLNFQKNK